MYQLLPFRTQHTFETNQGSSQLLTTYCTKDGFTLEFIFKGQLKQKLW